MSKTKNIIMVSIIFTLMFMEGCALLIFAPFVDNEDDYIRKGDPLYASFCEVYLLPDKINQEYLKEHYSEQIRRCKPFHIYEIIQTRIDTNHARSG